MIDQQPLSDSINRFRDELAREVARLGRAETDVAVIAVSKTVSTDIIQLAISCGLTHFGENRIQESREKIPLIQAVVKPTWHLVGHLQSNKAKEAVTLFNMIQSIDSWHLADEVNRRAEAAGKRQDILIQVNVAGEEQKSGCDPWDIDELVGDITALPHLRIQGLMAIGPLTEDEDDIATAFRDLRTIFDRLKSSNLGDGEMQYCSMGMSDDWKIALAEGSNMVRIGRAIFGQRAH